MQSKQPIRLEGHPYEVVAYFTANGALNLETLENGVITMNGSGIALAPSALRYLVEYLVDESPTACASIHQEKLDKVAMEASILLRLKKRLTTAGVKEGELAMRVIDSQLSNLEEEYRKHEAAQVQRHSARHQGGLGVIPRR